LRALLDAEVRHTNNAKLVDTITHAREADKKTKELKDIPVSVKASLLNVAILIKTAYRENIDELIEYRKLNKGLVLENSVEKNKALKDELPTLKELIDFTEKAYENGDWIKYVINYLMLTFGVRNQDINTIITKDGKEVTANENWLVIRGNSVRFIRYVFKTKDTYNCSDNEVKAKKFNHAVREILGDEDQKPLLISDRSGERIAESSLNRFVSKYTYDEIGETKYFKILATSNKKDIEKLSLDRGTAIGTIITNYDLDFENLHERAKAKAITLNELTKANAIKLREKCKSVVSKIPVADRAEAKKTKREVKRQNPVINIIEEGEEEELTEGKAKAEPPKPKKKKLVIKKQKLVIVE
jgi:hypothetical protein